MCPSLKAPYYVVRDKRPSTGVNRYVIPKYQLWTNQFDAIHTVCVGIVKAKQRLQPPKTRLIAAFTAKREGQIRDRNGGCGDDAIM